MQLTENDLPAMSRLGYAGTKPAVIYDDVGGGMAARLWFMLTLLDIPAAYGGTLLLTALTLFFVERRCPRWHVLLDQGRVLVQSLTVDGAAVGLNVVDEGAVVGEQALLAQTARSATVITVRPTMVRLLRPTQFRELRYERPEIDQFLLSVLDARLREMSNRLAEAVHSTAEERVCRRVLALGSAFDGMIQLSQATLASLAGTTRPTVNRVLQELVRDDSVRLRRSRIEVIDAEAWPAGSLHCREMACRQVHDSARIAPARSATPSLT